MFFSVGIIIIIILTRYESHRKNVGIYKTSGRPGRNHQQPATRNNTATKHGTRNKTWNQNFDTHKYAKVYKQNMPEDKKKNCSKIIYVSVCMYMVIKLLFGDNRNSKISVVRCSMR